MKALKKDTVIRARINSDVKDKATVVLASMGLTPSTAFCLLMQKVAAEKALPFDIIAPSAEAVLAMHNLAHSEETASKALRAIEAIDKVINQRE